MVCSQQLDRMAEADAIGTHHPLDHISARVAGSQAVPEILCRRDNQRGRPVVVERALADQVRTLPRQLDPPRLGQPLH